MPQKDISPPPRQRFPWVIALTGIVGLLMTAGFMIFSFLQSPSEATQAIAPLSVSSLDGFVISNSTTNDLLVQGTGLVGQSAPNFTLTTLEGNEVTLTDFRGRAVLINFWASWCVPCRLEMPALQQAYTALKDKGLVILGINRTYVDELPDVTAFVDEFKLTFPILLDINDAVNTDYQVLGLPTSIFINREGVVAHMQIGAMTKSDLKKLIDDIL
jgi:cytochrome c biogenesis protein CcmG, thiol:disulfide interchange protein DsbE